eukprot:6478837-Amphidinium_carterae.1
MRPEQKTSSAPHVKDKDEASHATRTAYCELLHPATLYVTRCQNAQLLHVFPWFNSSIAANDCCGSVAVHLSAWKERLAEVDCTLALFHLVVHGLRSGLVH